LFPDRRPVNFKIISVARTAKQLNNIKIFEIHYNKTKQKHKGLNCVKGTARRTVVRNVIKDTLLQVL
jgi:hypothetical protein